ncbi:hydroxysteroid dehydrogenase-like protein 2 isoform X2 [Brachyhypopomus gauderio]|uniref:hydroxysteroid dehydrogenase-like protein 2 isoform X2 n=1 Tax=Brachyhypopomus gauderio TaxID=698409 RepID=UPI0040416A93
MLQNTGKLSGCTVFITGASRGIGKAIALKAARDGANVVVAAKTADAHPKLPGTIYTAAEEIEAAGGKALPCVVDVRDEKQVSIAVENAVQKFGGIDILVNNASAISLTGTLETPMKKVDLMLGINLRGTYMTSKLCIPHLLKSKNPHILNLSPPLNLNPVWFKNHTAYTMAKYGMSMCVLGMAEEFRGSVAVNALWPRTAIQTAAMDMLGGPGVVNQCRKVEIMADAAYAVLSKPVSYTGQFVIDEDVLIKEGIKDFDVYAVKPVYCGGFHIQVILCFLTSFWTKSQRSFRNRWRIMAPLLRSLLAVLQPPEDPSPTYLILSREASVQSWSKQRREFTNLS